MTSRRQRMNQVPKWFPDPGPSQIIFQQPARLGTAITECAHEYRFFMNNSLLLASDWLTLVRKPHLAQQEQFSS